jgi:2-octaprenyl-6-methoxyphenol hydroxylase
MNMANPNHYDVIINGGGMVGMSLGIALARAGMRTAIIERGPMPSQLEPTFDGRASAVALGSSLILDSIGVWELMQPHGEPILDIRATDSDTPMFLHYDHTQVGDKPFGWIIENRHIRHALHEAGSKLESLDIIDRASIDAFETSDSHITVHVKGRTDMRCRLLIGADGKQSSVRKLAGIGAHEWSYRQTAIVCTIEHTEPHHGLAQERFLPAGPFAALPMTGNRSSLVWVEPEERVQLYMDLPDDEFVQEIKERVGNYLGDLRCTGPRFTYPLSLMHAKSYIAPRIALIGDAAHGMHPLAGQGVNVGFRDVGVLAELLVEQFRLGLDIGSNDVLEHYQRWRRFDNVTMLAVTDNLNRLFTNSILPIKLARGIGLWTVDKIPPLKRFFMRHAMGLVGDLPEMVSRKTT